MPGDEARVHDRDAGAGTVIAQVPPASTPAVPSTRVHRLVSDGPRPRRLGHARPRPGSPRRQAERWIAAAGFRRGTVRQVSMGGRAAGYAWWDSCPWPGIRSVPTRSSS